MAGGLTGLLEPIGLLVDPIFSPLTVLPPYITIILMSLILTSLVMFVSRIFVNRKLMIQIKEHMEEIKEKLSEAQKSGNKEEQNAQLSELMKVNSQYMTHSMRIMIVSITIAILLFPWLSYTYSQQLFVVENPTENILLQTQVNETDWKNLGDPHSVTVLHLPTSPIITGYAVDLIAEASDIENLKSLEIYLDNELVKNCTASGKSATCEATVGPFENAGRHKYYAVAIDDKDQRTFSPGLSVVELPFEIPIVNWKFLEWFWWYVISAFAIGLVMKKIMGSDI